MDSPGASSGEDDALATLPLAGRQKEMLRRIAALSPYQLRRALIRAVCAGTGGSPLLREAIEYAETGRTRLPATDQLARAADAELSAHRAPGRQPG